MNRSKDIRSCRAMAWIAVLLGAMLTSLALPAFGAQEVDPTWYDPWAVTSPAVVQSAQTAAAVPAHHKAVKSSSKKLVAKARSKRSASHPRVS
jgi:hypothetical protein